MTHEENEQTYGNRNRLVVDKKGRLVYISWNKDTATDYEVTGITDKLSFNLQKLKRI